MTKVEILNRKLETLENQEKNILNMLDRTQKEMRVANEERSFELNRKVNNIANRQEHYQKMLQNIAKDRADAEAELNQIASDGNKKIQIEQANSVNTSNKNAVHSSKQRTPR